MQECIVIIQNPFIYFSYLSFCRHFCDHGNGIQGEAIYHSVDHKWSVADFIGWSSRRLVATVRQILIAHCQAKIDGTLLRLLATVRQRLIAHCQEKHDCILLGKDRLQTVRHKFIASCQAKINCTLLSMTLRMAFCKHDPDKRETSA